MNKSEAKEYFKTTKLLDINLGELKKACVALKNEPEFLIDYPDYLGMYFKDIDTSAWHNVLLFETKEPDKTYNKLRLISYLVFNSKNLDVYLNIIVKNGAPQALVLSKKEFEEIDSLFSFVSRDFYFGYCEKENIFIIYIIKNSGEQHISRK